MAQGYSFSLVGVPSLIHYQRFVVVGRGRVGVLGGIKLIFCN